MAKYLPDGWHKFIAGETYFDVEVKDGSMVKGNIVWFDGAKYSGALFGDIISGRGTYTWPDGSRYEGAFQNNTRHGRGTMIETDGSKWGGKWKYNQRNGRGKVFGVSGTVLQKGFWVSDEYVGEKAGK
ncbi:hypothetical protein [Flagellimonas sp.]|uniref:hypothetical protein n=1 Tax=Flagellimonas sp. TaxID=2058762 RepID=UPI003F49E0AD